jgi:hypothetical protein
VPYTNNVSEWNLRPSVIFRKVTNGFRCEWGPETYAAFRSVVSTAEANRASVLAAIQFVLAARLPVQPAAGVGWGEQLPHRSKTCHRSRLSNRDFRGEIERRRPSCCEPIHSADPRVVTTYVACGRRISQG